MEDREGHSEAEQGRIRQGEHQFRKYEKDDDVTAPAIFRINGSASKPVPSPPSIFSST